MLAILTVWLGKAGWDGTQLATKYQMEQADVCMVTNTTKNLP